MSDFVIQDELKTKLEEILNPNKATEPTEVPPDSIEPPQEDSKSPKSDILSAETDPKSTPEPSESTISTQKDQETLESAQSINDKKTITRLTNKIKELEILLEAEKNDTLIQQKNENISDLEKQVAKAERELEEKEKMVRELEVSLKELQVKNEVSLKLR